MDGPAHHDKEHEQGAVVSGAPHGFSIDGSRRLIRRLATPSPCLLHLLKVVLGALDVGLANALRHDAVRHVGGPVAVLGLVPASSHGLHKGL